MKNILVLKTSSDATINRLFSELRECHIDCLIASSEIEKYRNLFPKINFIDIHREGFYDIESELIYEISLKNYDEMYITLSGTVGHNYGNVMELIIQFNCKKNYFYNCNGEKTLIPKYNSIKTFACMCLIKLFEFRYR